MNSIEIENLRYTFPDGTPGIVDLSVCIPVGTFVVLCGKNGVGKTTLLKHLNGLLLPDSGSVRVDGVSVSRNLLRARQVVGMVFQDADSQIVGETVWADTAFGPENLGLKRAEIDSRVEAALAAVGLLHAAQKQPHLLSGGEKRRLSIAGILAMRPKIVVLDEPFSSLDYSGVRQVLTLVLTLHAKGHTVLIATHDIEKVIFHADRLMIMQDGRIAMDGLPGEIMTHMEAFDVRAPCAVRMGREVRSWLE